MEGAILLAKTTKGRMRIFKSSFIGGDGERKDVPGGAIKGRMGWCFYRGPAQKSSVAPIKRSLVVKERKIRKQAQPLETEETSHFFRAYRFK